MSEAAFTPRTQVYLAALADAPAAFARGWDAAQAVDLPFPASAIRNVAICGMGGAAAAGEVVVGAVA